MLSRYANYCKTLVLVLGRLSLTGAQLFKASYDDVIQWLNKTTPNDDSPVSTARKSTNHLRGSGQVSILFDVELATSQTLDMVLVWCGKHHPLIQRKT